VLVTQGSSRCHLAGDVGPSCRRVDVKLVLRFLRTQSRSSSSFVPPGPARSCDSRSFLNTPGAVTDVFHATPQRHLACISAACVRVHSPAVLQDTFWASLEKCVVPPRPKPRFGANLGPGRRGGYRLLVCRLKGQYPSFFSRAHSLSTFCGDFTCLHQMQFFFRSVALLTRSQSCAWGVFETGVPPGSDCFSPLARGRLGGVGLVLINPTPYRRVPADFPILLFPGSRVLLLHRAPWEPIVLGSFRLGPPDAPDGRRSIYSRVSQDPICRRGGKGSCWEKAHRDVGVARRSVGSASVF